ncbi:MAG TPA: hypothetical protein VG477_05245 [Thermoanaerobaculia bacterium]|nr:hypothetical protein [Thermoanaerobaculia bacterium]
MEIEVNGAQEETSSAEDLKVFYERASRWIGAFEDVEGATDVSVNHDRYLIAPPPGHKCPG